MYKVFIYMQVVYKALNKLDFIKYQSKLTQIIKEAIVIVIVINGR